MDEIRKTVAKAQEIWHGIYTYINININNIRVSGSGFDLC
jgi:hypothetical protein